MQDDTREMIERLERMGQHDIADRIRAMDASLSWIVDRYMPPEGSGADSRHVDDFVVAAAGGLCGIPPQDEQPHPVSTFAP